MDLDLRSTKLANFHEPLKLFNAGKLHLTERLSWTSKDAGAGGAIGMGLTCRNNIIQ